MTLLHSLSTAFSTVMVALLVFGAVRGIRRRRGRWVGNSRARVVLTFGLGLGLVALSTAFPPFVATARGDWRTLLILGDVAILSLGAGVMAATLGWLAFADPQRPFPFWRRTDAGST